MNHKQYQQWIQLSLYGELEKADRQKLDRHLATCNRCRSELDSLMEFHRTLALAQPKEVTEKALADARRALRIRLGSTESLPSLVDRILGFLTAPAMPQYRAVLGAVATLAIGIGLGYYFFGNPTLPATGLLTQTSMSPGSTIGQGEARISNFRFVNRDESTGEVEFSFDATTPVHITGNVKNDERVQKLLARAVVSEDNPGARLRAVNTIAEHAEKEQPVSAEIKAALISALKYDENRGVRKEALRVLQHYLPDPEVVQAIVYVLKTEKNTGMKIAAINSLTMASFAGQTMNEELLSVLREKVQSDENNYIRLKAKAALREVKQQ